MSKLKKFWVDPVWSKVIASAIVGAFVLVPTLFGLWPQIWEQLRRIGGFFVAGSIVPNWLVGIGIVCTLLVFVVACAIIREIVWPTKAVAEWRAYVFDHFHGLRWQWRYADDGSIVRLIPLCAPCQYQVYPHNTSAFRAAPNFAFRCDLCGAATQIFEGEPSELEDKIVRMIQQKLRTDTWPRPASKS